MWNNLIPHNNHHCEHMHQVPRHHCKYILSIITKNTITITASFIIVTNCQH